jgi:hypothetical protein
MAKSSSQGGSGFFDSRHVGCGGSISFFWRHHRSNNDNETKNGGVVSIITIHHPLAGRRRPRRGGQKIVFGRIVFVPPPGTTVYAPVRHAQHGAVSVHELTVRRRRRRVINGSGIGGVRVHFDASHTAPRLIGNDVTLLGGTVPLSFGGGRTALSSPLLDFETKRVRRRVVLLCPRRCPVQRLDRAYCHGP